MTSYLKQSTSVDVGIGPFLDETDGKTAETALTITQPDIRLKKNGGAWAQKAAAQTMTHEENGWYEVTLDATDTNTLGILIVAIHESGALPVWKEYMVLPAMIYDSLVAGSDRLDTNVTHIADQSQTARDIGASVLLSSGTGTGQLDFTSGVVKASLVQILGTALTETAGQIAAAFKQFFDVGTPTGTMKAITNVVTTTNLTNAPTNGDLTATMKTSVTTAATAATPTAAAVTGAVGSVTGLTASDVGTILALLDDARGEPGQGAPPVNPDAMTKIDYLYKFLRNKVETTSTLISVYADNGTTVDHKSTISDDATTFTRGEFVTGA